MGLARSLALRRAQGERALVFTVHPEREVRAVEGSTSALGAYLALRQAQGERVLEFTVSGRAG